VAADARRGARDDDTAARNRDRILLAGGQLDQEGRARQQGQQRRRLEEPHRACVPRPAWLPVFLFIVGV